MTRLSSAKPRRGAVLIAALVAMAVLSIVLTVVTLQIVNQRQMLSKRHRQLQAEWLTRAGVELAAARLLENPAPFSDDQQELAPDSKVRIVVEKASPENYKVTVEVAVGAKDEPPVLRDVARTFRRTDSGGVIRLQVVPEGK